MAKKELPKKNVAAVSSSQKAQPSFRWTGAHIFPVAFCVVYFLLHFVSDWGAYDAMGAQWIYMVLVDLAVIAYLLIKKDDYKLAASKLFGNLFSKLYVAFYIFAGFSIFFAINPIEGIVCYVRMTSTIIAFFNIAILLYGRTDLFKIIAQILSLILLIDVLQTLSHFFSGVDLGTPLGELVFSLKGNDGNKNIFAAGLIVKLPFVLYGIHTFKLWGRILNIIIFFLTSILIFIISARATYLSLFLLIIMYATYCIFLQKKEKNVQLTLSRIAMILLPAIIAYFAASLELNNVKDMQAALNGNEGLEFGSVTERLLSVGKTEDESNQVRFRLWEHAVDYTKHHPLMGCGLGNWKIASIPYQRTITNDLFVPIHAHNDFLEAFAELGILGGLLYLSVFVCICVFTYKTFFSDANEQTRLISLFSFMAFATYMMDAMFNFPIERPISQMFFAFIAAVNVGAYIKGREEQKDEKVMAVVADNKKMVFALSGMLLLMPALYVTYQTYKSLIVQRSVLGDLNNEPLKLDWREIIRDFPAIPNLSATAQPIDAIKGRYLYEAGKFDEALVLLNKGDKANPVIGYSQFLKAGLYFRKASNDPKNEKVWLDSAFRNGMYAFYTRPKAKTYFQTLIAVLARIRDTANIQKAFEEYDRYRHHPFGWNLYLTGLSNAEVGLGRMPARMVRLADSGLALFPGDSDLLKRKSDIMNNYNVFNRSSGIQPATLNKSAQIYMQGVGAFNSGQAQKAAEFFLKAYELNPASLAAIENAAICYFNMQQYAKAIGLFDKELALNMSVDGKPEYFKAIALINMQKKEEGCKFMEIARNKKYVPVDKNKTPELILKNNCGK